MEKKKCLRQPSALKKAVGKACPLAMAAVLFMTVSCSDRVHTDLKDADTGKVPVTFRVSSIDQVPFGSGTRSQVPVSSVASHISFAIYTDDRKEQVNQVSSDEGFGTVSLNLSTGTHTVVVIAHNGDGNPTMTDIRKISFNNKETLKMTDTFLYYAEINVTSAPQVYDLNLERAVAMFQLKLTDTSVPAQVTRFQFDYTGGSNSVDATTGLGATKSTQSETIVVSSGEKEYGVYTFVRGDGNTLNMKVSAIDVYGNAVKEQTFEVPVTRNRITRYSGEFFKGGCLEFTSADYQMTADDAWAGTDDLSFNE